MPPHLQDGFHEAEIINHISSSSAMLLLPSDLSFGLRSIESLLCLDKWSDNYQQPRVTAYHTGCPHTMHYKIIMVIASSAFYVCFSLYQALLFTTVAPDSAFDTASSNTARERFRCHLTHACQAAWRAHPGVVSHLTALSAPSWVELPPLPNRAPPPRPQSLATTPSRGASSGPSPGSAPSCAASQASTVAKTCLTLLNPTKLCQSPERSAKAHLIMLFGGIFTCFI